MKTEAPSPAIANCPLLLIDDNVENLKLLERLLEWAGFTNVMSCRSAQAGLEALSTFDPHLIILDLKMPVMDGFAFMEKCRELVPETSFLPILVFTSDLTPQTKIRALEMGASDFLTKPGDALEIQLRVQNFLRTRKLQGDLQNHNQILEARVKERTEHLVVSRREAVELLARACEYRDDETGQHARRVGEKCAHIASAMQMNKSFIEAIRLAAPLHDVGKIAIPDSILQKADRLSEEETQEMRRHVAIGTSLLDGKASPLLQLAKEIAQYHHEHWNGEGYAEGLAGEAIPISARIVAVADAFDAMTNDRPYRKALTQDQALEELRAMAGKQFDPAVVAALERHLGVSNLGEDVLSSFLAA